MLASVCQGLLNNSANLQPKSKTFLVVYQVSIGVVFEKNEDEKSLDPVPVSIFFKAPALGGSSILLKK